MVLNVGPLERKLRATAGVALLVLAFFIEWPGVSEAVFVVLGLALIATALLRYCPLNQLLGIRSRGR